LEFTFDRHNLRSNRDLAEDFIETKAGNMVAQDGKSASHSVTNGSTENSTPHKAETDGGKMFKFPVTAVELGELSTESNRLALADLLEKAAKKVGTENGDVEAPSSDANILALVKRMRELEANGSPDEHSPEAREANKLAEVAANTLVTVLLGSSSETGISPDELDYRRQLFGSNEVAERKLDSFLKLCWEAVQDFVLIMLIFLGVIGIVVETTIGLKPGESCGTCWIEGAAILVSVVIVVCVTAGIDYAKQFAFIRLTKTLNESNTKSVIRNGVQVSVTDAEIVVGDILSVNSHNLASIPADCVLLGPLSDLKMDESSLTGESKPVAKRPGDVVLSGTTASQGSGKMVVIAVGLNSVSGKIKARVYASHGTG
jgi:Ca2+ transporting ATPase